MNERGVVAVPFRVALGFLLLLCLWSFLGEQFSGLDSNPNEYDVELLEKKRHNMTKVKASRGEFLESCRSCPCYDRDMLIPVGALPQSHSHKLLLSLTHTHTHTHAISHPLTIPHPSPRSLKMFALGREFHALAAARA